MPSPKVWGPAVWTLFHTLAEKIREDMYPYLSRQLFNIIVRICNYLPCPDCSADASVFLAKIKISDLKTKEQFKNTFYLFHNYVNAKKRKPLFNYANMHIYGKYRLSNVVNNFIINYQTNGNMKLLTESFQRQFVLRDFKNFISQYSRAFIPVIRLPPTIPTVINNNIDTYLSEHVVDDNVIIDLSNNFVVENIVNDFDNLMIQLSDNVETELDANVATELDANVATELDANVATELDANVATELDANVATELDANVVNDLSDNIIISDLE
jgi:hypothetical protein